MSRRSGEPVGLAAAIFYVVHHITVQTTLFFIDGKKRTALISSNIENCKKPDNKVTIIQVIWIFFPNKLFSGWINVLH